MMWHTHAAISASSSWLLLPLVPQDGSLTIAVLMALCITGAMVPDLDAVESKIKHVRILGVKPLVPVATVINRDLGHRGLLHSLYGWLIWTAPILPFSVEIGWLPVAALSLGYASHLSGDACTKTGIPALYPQKSNWHLLPRRWRITTGSDIEEAIFVLFSLLSMVLLSTHIQ